MPLPPVLALLLAFPAAPPAPPALGPFLPAPAPAAPQMAFTAPPTLTVARVQNELVLLRTAALSQPLDVRPGLPEVTMAERVVPLAEVRAFTSKGKKVGLGALRKLLAEHRVVAVSVDGRPLHPAYLRALRPGTLVLVFPVYLPEERQRSLR